MSDDKKKTGPFDYVKNINGHGERMDTDEGGYDPFVVNRVFSNTPDTVLFANELNLNWRLPRQMQYDFYRFGLSKHPRRFGKWEKREGEDDAALAIVMEVFGYSRSKAIEVLPILQPRMVELEALVFKGGRK